MRKEPLESGEVYHIFNRSIAGFKIFNHKSDAERMIDLLKYYQAKSPSVKFSYFARVSGYDKERYFKQEEKDRIILADIIAYCIMPTHFHLVLKQLDDNGISVFMNNVLNAYSRYFNVKYNRKGPLWEGRFRNRLVRSDEQLLHLTRYIHLNPTTAELVENPQSWQASSYNEYISSPDGKKKVCCYGSILDINPSVYKKFVEERVTYQKTLSEIKNLVID